MACTALAMDAETSLFLIGDGAYWGYEGRCADIHVAGFPALEELVGQFQEQGGRLTLCSACAAGCSLPVDDSGVPLRRRDGIALSGIAATLPLLRRAKVVTF